MNVIQLYLNNDHPCFEKCFKKCFEKRFECILQSFNMRFVCNKVYFIHITHTELHEFLVTLKFHFPDQ